MVEVGKFYVAGAAIYQILQMDGSFALVKNWNPGSGGKIFVMETAHANMRCLSDDFVAFVTGQE